MKRHGLTLLVALVLLILPVQIISADYVLHYNIYKYDEQIGESVEWFVDNILKPGDTLHVISPRDAYNFEFKRDNKTDLFKKTLKSTLKKDTTLEQKEVTTITNDMRSSLLKLSSGRKNAMQKYSRHKVLMAERVTFNLKAYKKLSEISKETGKPFTCFVILQQLNQPVPDRELERVINSSMVSYNVDLFSPPEFPSAYKKEIANITSSMTTSGTSVNTLFYKTRIHKKKYFDMANGTYPLYKSYKMMAKNTKGLFIRKSTIKDFFKKWKAYHSTNIAANQEKR